MPGALNITSDSKTDWQFGPIRASLEIRTSADDEDTEQYISILSLTRFRDHQNITAVSDISSSATEVIVGLDASFQGGPEITVDGDSGYKYDTASADVARWFLQDTALDPIEQQGSTYVRETQEWTAQTPDWSEAGA